MNSNIIKIVLGVLVGLVLSSWSSKDCYIFSPKATYYYAYEGGITASGSKVIPEKVKSGDHRWIAVSRDLINADFAFGDTVIIKSEYCPGLNGEWIIKDLMHSKWKNKIDFLVHKETVHKLEFNMPHKVELKKK